MPLLQATLSPAARDLIQRLLCDADERLGSHSGATEIKVPSCLSDRMCSPGGSSSSGFRFSLWAAGPSPSQCMQHNRAQHVHEATRSLMPHLPQKSFSMHAAMQLNVPSAHMKHEADLWTSSVPLAALIATSLLGAHAHVVQLHMDSHRLCASLLRLALSKYGCSGSLECGLACAGTPLLCWREVGCAVQQQSSLPAMC